MSSLLCLTDEQNPCEGKSVAIETVLTKKRNSLHRRSQGGANGAMPPQFLEYLVILCFERRYPMQNTVASLKSRIFPPKKNLGLAVNTLRLFPEPRIHHPMCANRQHGALYQ